MPGGLLSYQRLIGMCCWMGLHFHMCTWIALSYLEILKLHFKRIEDNWQRVTSWLTITKHLRIFRYNSQIVVTLQCMRRHERSNQKIRILLRFKSRQFNQSCLKISLSFYKYSVRSGTFRTSIVFLAFASHDINIHGRQETKAVTELKNISCRRSLSFCHPASTDYWNSCYFQAYELCNAGYSRFHSKTFKWHWR